jgi:hypothetical protein
MLSRHMVIRYHVTRMLRYHVTLPWVRGVAWGSTLRIDRRLLGAAGSCETWVAWGSPMPDWFYVLRGVPHSTRLRAWAAGAGVVG